MPFTVLSLELGCETKLRESRRAPGGSTHTHGPSGRRRQPCHLRTRPVWSTFFQRGAWEQVSKLNPRARWHLSR